MYPRQGRGAPPFQRPQGSPKSSSHRSCNAHSRDLGCVGSGPPLNLRFHGMQLLSFGTTAPPGPSSAGLEAKLSPHRTPRRAGRARSTNQAGLRSPHPSEATSLVATGHFRAPKPPPQGPKARSGGTKGQRAGTREALLPAPCTLTPQGTGQRSTSGRHAPPATWNRAWPPPKKNQKPSPIVPSPTGVVGGGQSQPCPGSSGGETPRE